MNVFNGCHRKNCATSKPKRNDKEIDNSLNGGERVRTSIYILKQTKENKQKLHLELKIRLPLQMNRLKTKTHEY